MVKTHLNKILLEKFGDPIGSYAGEPLIGVRDEEEEDICETCKMLKLNKLCGCSDNVSEIKNKAKHNY